MTSSFLFVGRERNLEALHGLLDCVANSTATYETRFGDVLRTYPVKKSGRGGFGEITLMVNTFRVQRRFTIRVEFA